jgi:hypothetical protein
MIENLPETLRNQLQLDEEGPAMGMGHSTTDTHRATLTGAEEVDHRDGANAPFVARRHVATGQGGGGGGGGSVVSSIGAEDWADAMDHASQTSSVPRYTHTHTMHSQTTQTMHNQRHSQGRHHERQGQGQGQREHGGRHTSSQIMDKPLETVTWSGLSSKSSGVTGEGSAGQEASSRRHLSEIDQSELDSRSRRHRLHTSSTTSNRHSHSASSSRHMIVSEDRHSEVSRRMETAEAGGVNSSLNMSNRSRAMGMGMGGNWTTSYGMAAPSSTPIDQLIAAILDGDVQGIRSVVRSRGDSLRSEFWGEIAHTVLPLHRAISGLHFHGNHKTLVQTLETLVQLGADVSAQDHTGNSVLHKVGAIG